MGLFGDVGRGLLAAGTLGLSEASGVFDPAAAPNAQAYQYGGGQAQADAYRRQYQTGVDQNLAAAGQGYAAMAAGQGPSAAVNEGRGILAQGLAQGNTLAASTRGGAGNQLAAMRQAQNVAADATLAGSNQAMITRAREQQAGLAGQAGVGAQYLGAQTGMESAQLGASAAADKARLEAEQAARASKLQFFGGVMKAGAGAASGGAA